MTDKSLFSLNVGIIDANISYEMSVAFYFVSSPNNFLWKNLKTCLMVDFLEEDLGDILNTQLILS